jgi:hypothetical protein
MQFIHFTTADGHNELYINPETVGNLIGDEYEADGGHTIFTIIETTYGTSYRVKGDPEDVADLLGADFQTRHVFGDHLISSRLYWWLFKNEIMDVKQLEDVCQNEHDAKLRYSMPHQVVVEIHSVFPIKVAGREYE